MLCKKNFSNNLPKLRCAFCAQIFELCVKFNKKIIPWIVFITSVWKNVFQYIKTFLCFFTIEEILSKKNLWDEKWWKKKEKGEKFSFSAFLIRKMKGSPVNILLYFVLLPCPGLFGMLLSNNFSYKDKSRTSLKILSYWYFL